MNISYEKVFDRYFGLIDDVKELSLEERAIQIKERMKHINGSISFKDLCSDCTNLHMVIVTFLSILEILAERLHSVISSPFIRRLFSTLKLDDEMEQFEFELTTSVDKYSDEEFVIELFSKGMAIKWLEPKVKSLENTVRFFGGKEEKKLKDDYSLNKALLKEMKIEQQKLIRDYGFAFKPYSSTES